MNKEIKNKIESGEGYVILPGFIPSLLIADFKSRLSELYPVRASSSKKAYAERDEIKNLEDISVWWSQTVHEFLETKKNT